MQEAKNSNFSSSVNILSVSAVGWGECKQSRVHAAKRLTCVESKRLDAKHSPTVPAV